MRLVGWVLLAACGGGDGGGGSDPTGPAGTDSGALPPWSQVVTTQEGTCCRTVEEAFEWTLFDLDGVPAVYAVPPDPQGLLLVFHGTNGVLETIRQPEWVELYNLLYPRGIAIAATLSEDRVAQQWDLSDGPDNPDVDRVDALLGIIATDTALPLDAPIVTLGFSQGCGMAELFADVGRDRGRTVVGVDLHNGGGGGPDDLPTLFVDAEHDPAAARMAAMADAHPDGTLLRGTEVPLEPQRFAKLPFVTPDESELIVASLVDMGAVDAAGARTLDFGDDPEAAVVALEAQIPNGLAADIAQQLRVVWAMHRFSAQNKLAEAQWIEAQIRAR